MKLGLTIWLVLFGLLPLLAQAPLGFNYQGIAREADGTPISNQTIGIRVNITEGANGNSQFSEEHFPETNEFGLFTLVVGNGNGNSTLNAVDWSGGNLWLQIELDPDNSGSYILMGSQQLMSVPYALYAQQSGGGLSPGYGLDITNGTISNVLPDIPVTISAGDNIAVSGTYPNFTIESTATVGVDDDADPTNELQTISKTGSEVTLSDGGGSFIDQVDDADADATNEIQDLQLSGNILTITNNGTPTSIDLISYLDNTDTQLTESEVDTYVSNNGYLTTELDDDPTNEFQSISKTGATVTLSDGGGSFTDEVDDADADATNEIQTISKIGSTVTLSNSGGSFTDEVNDADFDPANEIQNLANVLAIDNSAGNTKIIDLADPTLAQDAATKSYIDAAVGSLSTNISSNASAIATNATDIFNNAADIGSSATNITSNASAIAGIQAELDDTQTGAGLDVDGGYTADGGATYINTASSLKDADSKLDAQIQSNATNITTLTGRLDNTYAFQAGFTINEVGMVFENTVTLSENLDGFNQIASNQITIGATGLYMIVVDAERTNTDANLSRLIIRVNATDYIIYVSTSAQNIARTLMLNLVVGDVMSLLDTTMGAQGVPLIGVIGGYKISD